MELTSIKHSSPLLAILLKIEQMSRLSPTAQQLRAVFLQSDVKITHLAEYFFNLVVIFFQFKSN